jgi:hypothetical protein
MRKNVMEATISTSEKHCRNVPSENPQRDRFSAGESRYEVGEGEKNAAQVVLGWLVA